MKHACCCSFYDTFYMVLTTHHITVMVDHERQSNAYIFPQLLHQLQYTIVLTWRFPQRLRWHISQSDTHLSILAFSDSFYGSFYMGLTTHHIHGDGGPRLLLRGVKHAQLEALSQHTHEGHVNVCLTYQSLTQAVLQI